jgi:hypothetical protein
MASRRDPTTVDHVLEACAYRGKRYFTSLPPYVSSLFTLSKFDMVFGMCFLAFPPGYPLSCRSIWREPMLCSRSLSQPIIYCNAPTTGILHNTSSQYVSVHGGTTCNAKKCIFVHHETTPTLTLRRRHDLELSSSLVVLTHVVHVCMQWVL